FTVSATDSRGAQDRQPFQVVVTDGAVSNNTVSFTSTAPTTAHVGKDFVYQPTASETITGTSTPSTDPLFFYLLKGPDLSMGDMTIDRFTGQLSWTPTAAIADQLVLIEVTDGKGASDTQEIHL